MKGYLSNKELLVSFCFTIGLYLTIGYQVQALSNQKLSTYKHMSEGWKSLNRRQDDRDIEWQSFKHLMEHHWHWFVIHIVCGELVRNNEYNSISPIYCTVGFIACIDFFNIQLFLVLLLQTLISYGVGSVLKKKRYVWLLAILWLFTLNILKSEEYWKTFTSALFMMASESSSSFGVVFAWCILKNISFNIERVKRKDENFNLVDCLGYVFFVPTFHCGPFFLYTRYMTMLHYLQDHHKYTIFDRVRTLTLRLLRCLFWFLMAELGLHFFYIYNITVSIDAKSLNNFALAGIGFLRGIFFNIKYVVMYGVTIAIGEFEYIPMPSMPRCICRVHKYVDMWKWFDHGLYEFLFKYIYTELAKQPASVSKKLFASITTFCFIYFWHGLYTYILIWCAANFTCIVLEKLVYWMIDSDKFQSRALVLLKTEENVHMLKAVIAANVMCPAVLSNAFFFGGIDYGMECLRRTYTFESLNYFKMWGSFSLLYPVPEAIKLYLQQPMTKASIKTE